MFIGVFNSVYGQFRTKEEIEKELKRFNEVSFFELNKDTIIAVLDPILEDVIYLNDSSLTQSVYNSYGIAYCSSEEYNKALKYYYLSLNYINNKSSITDKAILYGNISGIHMINENNKEALLFINKSLNLLKEINDSNYTGSVLFNKGLILFELKDTSEALINLNLSLTFPKNAKKLLVYELLGKIYLNKREYNKAINNFNTSLKILDSLGLSNKSLMYALLGRSFYELNQKDSASFFYEKAEQSLTKHDDFLSVKIYTNLELSWYYEREGDYKKSLECKNAYLKLNDSYDSKIDIESYISIMSKGNSIKIKESDSIFKFFIFCTLLIVGLISLFLILRKRIKVNNTINNSFDYSHYNLSKRETEIVDLLLKGYSNTRISEELFISSNTVKVHRKKIYKKLEVNSIQELMILF